MKQIRLGLTAIALVAALALAGCGDDDADKGGDSSSDSSNAAESGEDGDDQSDDADVSRGSLEEQLAVEYCDIVQAVSDAGDNTARLDATTQALTDWLEANKDARGDPDEFAEAVQETCDIDINDPLG